MAANGVKTADLVTSATLDTLIGNHAGTTKQTLVTSFVEQLRAVGAFESLPIRSEFKSRQALLDDLALTYDPNLPGTIAPTDLVSAGHFILEIAPAAAVDHHDVTLGGVKLYEAGATFTTLARFQDASARGVVWRDGDLVSADGVVYVARSGSSSIVGLAGFDYYVPANALDTVALGGQLPAFYRNATNLNVGTVDSARLNIGTSANQLIALDASARLPAVDGSQLTNLPSGAGLPPPDYTATVTTWTNGTAVTLVHGLGATPKIVLVWFVCAVADGGWAVGDRIPTDYDHGTTRGVNVGFNGSDIILGPLASYPRLKDNSSYLTLTATNWNIEVSAWA